MNLDERNSYVDIRTIAAYVERDNSVALKCCDVLCFGHILVVLSANMPLPRSQAISERRSIQMLGQLLQYKHTTWV
jgi:hypothetical protein